MLSALCLLSLPGPLFASALVHGQGLLWRLEARGYQTSYLFGTMHVTDERVLRLPEPVLRAFDASQRCLFELIVPEDDLTYGLREMQLPQGVYLRDIVGNETYNKIVAAAGRYGIPTADVGRLHPAALLYVLRLPAGEWLRRRDGWAFLDLALQNEARALGKPIHALETVAEQMAVHDKMSREEALLLLNGMLESVFAREQAFETMLQYYIRGDMDAWYSQEEAGFRALPEDELRAMRQYRKRLLDDRNRVMVRRMLPHLRMAPSFVAVGAAHLGGPLGILQLLEAEGFRVTRIY